MTNCSKIGDPMKKLILAVALLATIALSYGSALCEGYDAGYKAGYCYGKNFCMEPMSPMCPMARMGEDTYKDGYNRGFLAGVNKQ